MQAVPGRLIVIGYGNMGKALAHGLTTPSGEPRQDTLFSPDRVIAVDPGAASESTAVRLVPALELVGPLGPQDEIILAVKPQVYPSVAPALAATLPQAGAFVLSIMAGVTTRRLAADLGPSARIVRAMPNTPSQIGAGATAFTLGPGATESDAARAERFLLAVGPLVVRIDESLMDAFTAVGGSGPAYLFHLAESMTAGAIAAGFDPATADAIVRQTLAGSAALLAAQPGASAAELRARVTSKGGTTEAALHVLSQRATHDAVVAAILAARDRGRELGKQR